MAEGTLESLDAQALAIPFRSSFRHASAVRAQTAAVWVRARGNDGVVGYGEGCPRPYVTGETVAGALDFIARQRPGLPERLDEVAQLRALVARRREPIDTDPAAWCALELALLDLAARQQDRSVEAWLGLPELAGPFRYSAVLGDADAGVFRRQFERYRRSGFRDFKVKLSGDLTRDRLRLRWLMEHAGEGLQVRVDANNLWSTTAEALAHLQRLDVALEGIEEPLQPGQLEDCARLADTLGIPIILDESLLRVQQLDALARRPELWILNLRVSKLGGLIRSLEILEVCADVGLRVIVGAQVGETSVLTRAALVLAQRAGARLVAQEGAFGTELLVEDVCDPPLMFGHGGILDPAAVAGRPGLGLAVRGPYR